MNYFIKEQFGNFGLGAAAVDQVHAGFDAWKSMAS